MQAAPTNVESRGISLPERVAFRAPNGTNSRLEALAHERGATPGQLARHLLLRALEGAR